MDQLQYELTTQSRRATDELSILRQRVTDLELQLVQTRREADEYFKSGLERNAEATSLGNQVMNMTPVCQLPSLVLLNPQGKMQKKLSGRDV